MGVKGGWGLLNPTDSVSLVEWSAQIISMGTVHSLGPCIGVNARWMFATKYHHGQTKSTAQASLFKQLGRLFHLLVLPLFVFDGPKRPVNKHKKRVNKMTDWLTAEFKDLLEGFGFSYWDAPGEAEAELALLSNKGRIDVVMSEDFNTMLFSAQRVMRITDESDSKYMVNIYERGSQFSPNELVMIALLSGGDYNEGIKGCGIQTAADITLMGIGEYLFEALETSLVKDYPAIASKWCHDLCVMLESQGVGHHHALASRIPLDFPKVSVVVQYIQPLTSSNGMLTLPAAPSPCPPDIPKLARLCEKLFVWGHSMGIIKKFSDHIFPGLVIRELLQDLCKRRGTMLGSDVILSPYTVIDKVCSIHMNQRERSASEIFVSLTIPHTIITQISSSIDGKYDTDITQNSLDQWLQKHQVRMWLSHVLALHAWPTILDNKEHLISKTARKCGPLPGCTKGKAQEKATPGLAMASLLSRKVVTGPVREESEHVQETLTGK
ncbi:PIN domain-like protein [Armillaria mellea]|nr:PIN domain-like protein [Armillaria mellea]